MIRTASFAAALAIAGYAAPAAAQEGDPVSGGKIYKRCQVCHALKEGQHRVGPSLHGVVGREAGSAEGFNRYSPAMQNAGIVWNDEELSNYLADPRGYIPGNRMAFPGLPKEQDRLDVIAFLKQAAEDGE